jgi:ABC-type proline/glycine betaine transport system permease subunit
VRLLVVGGGGREHALCWALRRENPEAEIYCAPGNPGTAEVAQNLPIAADDLDRLADGADMHGIDLTIVGPEAPLARGLADRLRAEGRAVFGPSAAAAQLEASKAFIRQLCEAQSQLAAVAAKPVTEFPRFLDYQDDAFAAVASRGGAVGHAILGITGVIQTIPSLALLALLVPLPFFGISARTAIVALFLYGLLPIVRNTASGLQDIPKPLRESAIALGLTAGQRLRKIFLPLASRSILSGIKTSAVISIGTATLAALIGAGGLGEPIISGLNLNDHVTILEGAIPAALLALLVQFLFDLLDRVLIPRGLRL